MVSVELKQKSDYSARIDMVPMTQGNLQIHIAHGEGMSEGEDMEVFAHVELWVLCTKVEEVGIIAEIRLYSQIRKWDKFLKGDNDYGFFDPDRD